MKLKFSLKWLLASVAVVAIASAALVNATQAWSQVMFSVALVLLLSSILAAMYTGRGFYAGFSLFAGAYWLLVVPPAWSNHFARRLPTWPISEYVFELVSHEDIQAQSEMPRGLGFVERTAWEDRQRTITRPSPIFFRSVAQFCWVIVVGLLGGVIGVYIKAATVKGTPSDSASVHP